VGRDPVKALNTGQWVYLVVLAITLFAVWLFKIRKPNEPFLGWLKGIGGVAAFMLVLFAVIQLAG
jgi:hypothetical protein